MALKDSRGFWINARGEAVHPDNVKISDKIKDELLEKLMNEAMLVQKDLKEFKDNANEQIENYYELLLQEYDVDAKGRSKKGNLNLENFSSTYKIQIAMSECLSFDEKLNIAKAKIDEYLNDVTKDSPAEIRTLITKAFEVDKKGNIDSKKIFALKSYEISDERWIKAMNIIDESKQVSHIKPYIRFYARKSTEEPWNNVKLDLAGI